jgi:hypothetical protein
VSPAAVSRRTVAVERVDAELGSHGVAVDDELETVDLVRDVLLDGRLLGHVGERVVPESLSA